ncbi:uncharacterized protein LOC134240769 [Saccostrea cucullata]|uniref:uncharacterized protein LOC134240769 n=1 Tax=Saccostrea cuccullata TaxID=36930 RepID=UPI002ED38EA4
MALEVTEKNEWKRFLGDACQTNEDCTGTPNGGICRNPENYEYNHGKCHCNDGFTEFANRCLQDSVGLGDECKLNAQCLNNGLLTHCSQRKLKNVSSCMDPYIKFDQQCILVGKFLQESCFLDEQCTGTENAFECQSGACGCKKGYFRKDNTCIEVNKIDYKSFVLGSGGFLLGVFSTVIVFASFRKGGCARRENQRSDIRLTSDTRNDDNQYSYVEHRDIRNQIELSSYNPEHQDIQTKNVTYNHLHEERQNISENDYGFFRSK